MARIFGDRFDNSLFGTLSADDIFGDRGNDEIWGGGGLDRLRGGRGDDIITAGSLGAASGDAGNDIIFGEGARLYGGDGHDVVYGLDGDFFGHGGNDTLMTFVIPSTGEASQRGGKGFDTHIVQLDADGFGAAVFVRDFTPGADHVGALLNHSGGGEEGIYFQDRVFGDLDTNGNGTLGDDVPADANGEAFFDPATDRFVIRMHEDYLVVDGVDKLTVADWAF